MHIPPQASEIFPMKQSEIDFFWLNFSYVQIKVILYAFPSFSCVSLTSEVQTVSDLLTQSVPLIQTHTFQNESFWPYKLYH